jgi:homoserine dehydrogenase
MDNASNKIVRVGMLGFGTVGSGVAQILNESRPPLKDKTGLDIRLHKIAVRDIKKARSVNADAALLTTNAEAVVNDPEVDVLVEVIGGIEPARAWS